MDAAHRIASIGALIGDPTRAMILCSLFDGRAWSAGELARAAGVTPQTVSFHLAMLVNGGLLSKAAQGRHRYFRLASAEIAQHLEALMNLSPQQKSVPPQLPSVPDPLRDARTCYDHLAGRLGVAVTDALLAQRLLHEQEQSFTVTEPGLRFFQSLGIDTDSVAKNRRALTRKCLDWSERRYHLAGALGAEFNNLLLQRRWLRRLPDSRAVRLTPRGRQELKKLLDIEL